MTGWQGSNLPFSRLRVLVLRCMHLEWIARLRLPTGMVLHAAAKRTMGGAVHL
jgi:hypothetical protein